MIEIEIIKDKTIRVNIFMEKEPGKDVMVKFINQLPNIFPKSFLSPACPEELCPEALEGRSVSKGGERM